MIDFLIYYEHKVRELEYITLLKIELEKRGYTVDLCYTGIPLLIRRKKYYKNVRVVVAMAMYRNYDLYRQVYSVTGAVNKIVNLQWEQIYTNEAEKAYNSSNYPQNEAKKVLHLCWGKTPYNNLLKAGINKDNLFLTGPLHMDFLSKPLINFYKNRSEIFQELNLSMGLPTILFISSFSCTNLTNQQKEDLLWCIKKEQLDYLEQISIESKRKIIDWIVQYLEKNPNCNFIYRPHPGEIEDEFLYQIQKKYPQFFILNQYSVKQWILISDKVLTWMSTSTVDAYFAKIPCAILRPVEIKQEKDMTIFNGSKFIQNYNEFEYYLENDVKNSLDSAVVESYYQVDNVKSYLKICDLLEKLLTSNNYDFKWETQVIKDFQTSLFKDIMKETLKTPMRPFIHKFYHIISRRKSVVYSILKERITLYKKVYAQKRKDYATKQERDDVSKRLKKIL